MLNPYWIKVLRDLWSNKTRTTLVVLSIAVGVFAVGMMASSLVILSRNMDETFLAIRPASARLDAQPFDEDLVQAVRNMREVGAAEGRFRFDVRVQVGNGEWRNLQLYAIPDYDSIPINNIVSESGAWPPPDRSLLIERAALGLLNVREGETITIETPGRKQRSMPVTGVAHDLYQWPANFGVIAYGYITFDTLEWLGQPYAYNELYIVAAEQPYAKAHVQDVAALVRDKVEKTGHNVFQVNIRTPGRHNAYDLVQSLTLMLGLIGAISLLLSGFLVVNTISALLAQQVRQIGIMKAIGAGTRQVMQLYLSMVVAFGLLALLIAIPLGVVGAKVFTEFILNLFNFNLVSFTIPPLALALQILVGLIVPLLAALYPIIAGTRITVRDAVSGQESAAGGTSRSLLGRLLPVALVVRLPQSLILAFRNTFRRKGRLALTLLTLTLGGAMFISVINVRSSLFRTLDDIMQYWNFDLEVNFQHAYNTQQLEREVLQVPGVVAAEGWGGTVAFRVRPDGSEHELIALMAPPSESMMIKPIISHGRWLLPGDENGIVVNTAFILEEPDVKVGDTIVLKIEGRETPWQVVGIATGQIAGMGSMAYANNTYLAQVVNEPSRTTRLLIATERHDPAFRAQVRQELEAHLKQNHLRVNTINSHNDIRSGMEGIFNIFVIVTIVMAILLAVVGGLGLMGLMSLNILERRREIGVLRAVGATNGAVLRIVMSEGVFIGLISWLLAAGLAVPFSKLFSYGVGVGFLSMPLASAFSSSGLYLWFVVAVLLSALASFLPAWHAASLTVRDVLAYE